MIESEGHYLVPEMTEGHMHVASSMCTITEYVSGVLPHSTIARWTGMISATLQTR